MQRIQPIDPANACGRSQELLGAIQDELGMTPNLARTLAHSPAALSAYRSFGAALSRGTLSAGLRAQIALTISEANRCAYCVAANTAAARALGLSDETIADSRLGSSPDSKTEAALVFARAVLEQGGSVSDRDLGRVRRAEYGDGEIAEIVANVALSFLTNTFNHVAETGIDFPAVPELETS